MRPSGPNTENEYNSFKPRRKCKNFEECRRYIEPGRRDTTDCCHDCSVRQAQLGFLERHGFQSLTEYIALWMGTLGREERRRRWREQKRSSRKVRRERKEGRSAAQAAGARP